MLLIKAAGYINLYMEMLLVVAVHIIKFNKIIIKKQIKNNNSFDYWIGYKTKGSGLSGIFVPHVPPKWCRLCVDLLSQIPLAVGSFGSLFSPLDCVVKILGIPSSSKSGEITLNTIINTVFSLKLLFSYYLSYI